MEKYYPTIDTRNHLNIAYEPFPVTDHSAYVERVYRNKRSGVLCILAVRPVGEGYVSAYNERLMEKISEQYDDVDA